jgi:hypothetical protein
MIAGSDNTINTGVVPIPTVHRSPQLPTTFTLYPVNTISTTRIFLSGILELVDVEHISDLPTPYTSAIWNKSFELTPINIGYDDKVELSGVINVDVEIVESIGTVHGSGSWAKHFSLIPINQDSGRVELGKKFIVGTVTASPEVIGDATWPQRFSLTAINGGSDTTVKVSNSDEMLTAVMGTERVIYVDVPGETIYVDVPGETIYVALSGGNNSRQYWS